MMRTVAVSLAVWFGPRLGILPFPIDGYRRNSVLVFGRETVRRLDKSVVFCIYPPYEPACQS